MGSFYIIPSTHLSCLVSSTARVPLLSVEDVYVTGLLRRECGVGLQDVPRRWVHMVLTVVLVLCYSEPVTRVRCGVSCEDMVVVAYQNYNMTQLHRWGKEKKPMWC